MDHEVPNLTHVALAARAAEVFARHLGDPDRLAVLLPGGLRVKGGTSGKVEFVKCNWDAYDVILEPVYVGVVPVKSDHVNLKTRVSNGHVQSDNQPTTYTAHIITTASGEEPVHPVHTVGGVGGSRRDELLTPGLERAHSAVPDGSSVLGRDVSLARLVGSVTGSRSIESLPSQRERKRGELIEAHNVVGGVVLHGIPHVILHVGSPEHGVARDVILREDLGALGLPGVCAIRGQ